MATGTAYAGQCYSTQAEAGQMWCSAMSGVGSTVLVNCISVSGFSDVGGGAANGTATMRIQPYGQPSYDGAMSVTLQACETYGFDYWEAGIGLWAAVCLSIIGARIVVRRFFSHHSV